MSVCPRQAIISGHKYRVVTKRFLGANCKLSHYSTYRTGQCQRCLNSPVMEDDLDADDVTSCLPGWSGPAAVVEYYSQVCLMFAVTNHRWASSQCSGIGVRSVDVCSRA